MINSKKSFTLMELLVVVAIMSLFMIIFIPALRKAKEMDTNVTHVDSDRQIWSTLISDLRDSNDYFPDPVSVKSWDGAYDQLNNLPQCFASYGTYQDWSTGRLLFEKADQELLAHTGYTTTGKRYVCFTVQSFHGKSTLDAMSAATDNHWSRPEAKR